MLRDKYCGEFSVSDAGAVMNACGWVVNRRDMGGVVFLDLRDRTGDLQIVCARDNALSFETANEIKLQSVVRVRGLLRERSDDTLNPRIITGRIEMRADEIEVYAEAEPLPISLEEDNAPREELRLKYRYLDLRRPKMQRALALRHRLRRTIDDYLDAAGFTYVETPELTRSTPEGARDYLVPSRVHPGEFYALPQSPQIFKQLLMLGGTDRYYQFARCFRDEDLRADRQPEFTQVDMEMSFVTQEDILTHLESMFARVLGEFQIEIARPLPRITWTEAMDRYGSDKPDTRFGLEIVDITDIALGCGFGVFRRAAQAGGVVRLINARGRADMPRREIDELGEKCVRDFGAKGMAWIGLRADGSVNSVLTKFLTRDELEKIIERADAEPGDLILFGADTLENVRRTLGMLRLELGERFGMRDKSRYSMLFVTEFPEFEYSQEEGRWVATHHPFTMPYPEDVQFMESQPARVRAQAYDVVLNGVELGSGSMRIHSRELQARMFRALGFSEAEIEERFGFLVNAFRFGAPPHGGFAFGLDRLAMLMLGADSLREVIAFPKLRDASCAMSDAPHEVEEAQLKALMLSGKEKPARARSEIERVAELARIKLDAGEMEKLPRAIERVMEFAGRVRAGEREYHGSVAPRMREDAPRDSGIAPGGYYRTPRAIG